METLYEYCIKNVPGLYPYLVKNNIVEQFRISVIDKEKNTYFPEDLRLKIKDKPSEVFNFGINWLKSRVLMREAGLEVIDFSRHYLYFSDNYKELCKTAFISNFKNIKLI